MLAPPPDFLTSLRRRGVALGLGQIQRLGRLAERWEGDDAESLRTAIAALLATSPEEVEVIKEAFDLTWPPPPKDAPEGEGGAPLPGSAEGEGGEAARGPSQRSQRSGHAPGKTDGLGEPSRLGQARARLRRLAQSARALLRRQRLLLLCVLLAFLSPPPGLMLPRNLAAALAHVRAGDEVRVPLPSLPSCPETNLPAPLVIRHYGKPGLCAGLLALLVLLLVNQARARHEHRRRARRYVRERLDALPAPHSFRLQVPELPAPLPREDLEDMATLLGRLKGTGRDLDVPRTLERTVRGGMLLAPVYRVRAMGGTILLLQDVGAAMRPFQRKVEALVSGLSRLGVPLERWYFEGDASQIRDRPSSQGGRWQPLQDLARLHGPTPILVVTSGGGAVDEESGGPARWILELERLFPVRTLLHPVAEPRRWHPLLRRWQPVTGETSRHGPITVRPMTRAGVHQAACELALTDESYTPREARRAVTPDDVARLLELLAIPGEAALELLELLRQRFAPDVPEEVMLHVLARCGDLEGGLLRLSSEQRVKLLQQGRRRKGAPPPPVEPEEKEKEKAARPAATGKPGVDREIAVRRLLLLITQASKPPQQESAARQRWRLALAAQQLYVPDDAGQAQALETLLELSRGPLRGELRRTLLPLGRRPSAAAGDAEDQGGNTPLPLPAPLPAALRGKVLGLLRDLGRNELASGDGLSLAPRRHWVALPGLAEPLSAVLCAALVFGGAAALGLVPSEEVPHLAGSYRLTRDASAPDYFTVELTQASVEGARAGRIPVSVDLYRDDEEQPLQRNIAVGERDNLASTDEPAPGEGNRLPKVEDDRVRCYHARARLPRGNFALSGQLFVAGARVAPNILKGQLLVRFLSGRTGTDLGGLPFGVGNGFGETAAGRGGQLMTLSAGAWSLQSAGTPAYGSVTRALSVRPNAVTVEEITLMDYATLEITGLPRGVGAEQVLINGIPWRGGEVRVQPGQVQIALDHPYYDERQEVTLAPGEKKSMAVAAVPRYGIVMLRVMPQRAELLVRGLQLLDQKEDDEASLWRLRGEAGSYPVTASAPAYQPRQLLLEVTAGETLRQDLALEGVPGMGVYPVPGGGARPSLGITADMNREPLREPSAERVESALGPLAPPPPEVMLRVPGGVFRMGSDKGDPDQAPQHEVAVATFLIDKTEVTAGAYQRCVQSGACSPPGSESRYCNGNQPAQRDHPINCVTYTQARAFCAWAGKRLPTEAEWEYAARGGDGRLFPWGDEPPGGQLCWRRYPTGGTCAVGSHPSGRSPFGVLDLAGNVAEWTADLYCGDYNKTCTTATERVVRGGSWYNGNRGAVQAVDRRSETPVTRNSDLGFRCARGAL